MAGNGIVRNHVSTKPSVTIRGADFGIRSAILSPDGTFIVSNGWGTASSCGRQTWHETGRPSLDMKTMFTVLL